MTRFFAALTVLVMAWPCVAHAQQRSELTPRQREEIVTAAAQTVEENFYDSERGAIIAGELRNALQSGGFDDADSTDAVADALTQLLHVHDNHFTVRRAPPGLPQGDSEPDPDGQQAWLDAMARTNYGFREVSILPGNVGYIDMREFAPAQLGGDTALAALNFVENTDAVIFDMRQNRGGAPSMVQFLISHFLDPDEETVINTFVSSARDYPSELPALAWLPGEARPAVPLYVLTSGRTGSAGEAFPYHLQAMERATIVGETTYGAGNPGGFFPLPHGLAVFVSTGSARNPITGTNWEGTGVIPDVETPAEAALDAALSLAYSAILETATDAAQRRGLEWSREAIDIRQSPVSLDAPEDYAGTYGPRRIWLEDGSLMYQRGDAPPLRLVPLGSDRFLLEGLDDVRVVFTREDGRVTSMTLQSLGQPDSVSPRSG